MKITKEEIEKALDAAYKEAGHNAYFGSGFMAGVEFMEEQDGWIPCAEWEKLPVGTWLVKINKSHDPYHVATVTITDVGDTLIIVGNHFSWDMGKIEKYKAIKE